MTIQNAPGAPRQLAGRPSGNNANSHTNAFADSS
jgi:hypothetical protein